jgi:hypothetical protein
MDKASTTETVMRLVEAAIKAEGADEDEIESIMSRLLLDVPSLDWPLLLVRLLHAHGSGKEGETEVDTEAHALRLRVSVHALAQVMQLRPSCRLVVLESLLSLLSSPSVDMEVAEACHEAIAQGLGQLH